MRVSLTLVVLLVALSVAAAAGEHKLVTLVKKWISQVKAKLPSCRLPSQLLRAVTSKTRRTKRAAAETDAAACMDGTDQAQTGGDIPIIDISGLVSEGATSESRKRVALEIAAACEEIGFFVITGHGVPQATIDNMWSNTSAFFDMPVDYKDTMSEAEQSEYPFGYSGIGGEVLSAGKDAETQKDSKSLPDLKELFSLGPSNPEAGFPARKWPDQPAGFEASWALYYDTLAELAAKILQGFAIGLDRDETYFTQYLTRHASAVRAINYPSYEGYTPPAGQLRASAHTDYGTITILKSGGPGLQVSKDSTPPRWVDVPFVEDGFIVNLGDLMRRWTNDKWLSTLHRVVNPDVKNGGEWMRRQSIAFFHNPNRDAVVTPLAVNGEKPKHEAIIAGDFLMQKHLAAVGGQ